MPSRSFYMERRQLRVNCHRCGAFAKYTHNREDPDTVIRCSGCGKKHSTDSLHMVDTLRDYQRDETGTLIEQIP